MMFALAGALYFLLATTRSSGSFLGFFIMFMILFICAGIGNGSTYRMIPIIYLSKNRHSSPGDATHTANKQSGAVVGITSAFAAYGAFFIPKSFGTSIDLLGTPAAALVLFMGYYLLCLAVTYSFYLRRGTKTVC